MQTLGSGQSDIGTEVGGAIVKNRLFFFGAVDSQWGRRTLHAPEGFPLGAMGDVNQDRRNGTYAVKVTFEARSGHRFDASFFGDPSTGATGPQRSSALLNTDTAAFSTITYGGHNQTIRYAGVLSSRWFIEAAFSRAENGTYEVPSVDEWHVVDNTVTPSGATAQTAAQ